MSNTVDHVFRQSMRRLAATVSVITCASDGMPFGVTATAVSSLCAEPPSLLVCLNATASITTPLLREKLFCVNLLHSDQAEISTMFGGKAARSERFAYGTWGTNVDGVPYLIGAQANLFCRIDGSTRYGTHHIVIGRVSGGEFAPDVSPLIYQDGGYASSQRLVQQAHAAA